MEKSGRKQAIITVIVVAFTIFAVLGALALAKKKSNKNLANTTDSTNDTQTTQNSVGESATNTAQTNADTLKDGTYKATGSYSSPGGNEKITVTVTLKDGVVTETSATSGANDQTSKQYQAEFIAGYKDEVVGKKITTVKLSRVAGSSLTSQGFNDAIQQIKQQAKA